MLPADVAGLDTIELGCGTALRLVVARAARRPAGGDRQLRGAAGHRTTPAGEHGLEFPLHHGNAEETPFADASFDLAISEYGASIWCDPYRWIPEAARLLRPGGRLHFLVNSPLLMLCPGDDENSPAGTTLLRPYFGMHRLEWPGDPSVEFHLPHGEMIRLLRDSRLRDRGARRAAGPGRGHDELRLRRRPEWAHRWPSEEIWRAVKRA